MKIFLKSPQQFDKAAENAKVLKTTPADNDLLDLYGLYKQALVGDCNTDKPGFLDFKGKSKWEAWNARKGVSSDEAKELYVTKVNNLIDTIGLA